MENLIKTIHPHQAPLKTKSNEGYPTPSILPSRFVSVSGIEKIPSQLLTPVEIAVPYQAATPVIGSY